MTFRAPLLLAVTAFGTYAHAQRPIQTICSNNPQDKLPACTAPAAPATPQPSAPPPTAAQPSVAEQFPFPGEQPPASVTLPSGKPTPAAENPFPGEQAPVPPGKPAATADNPFPGESSSSSSSTGSSDQPQPALTDEGSEGTSRASRRRVLPKVEDLEAREEEDVRVAHYYHSTGNFLAAYNRAKDAVRLAPDDAEAYLALALNAQKLAKRDEAVTAYTTYLKLDPQGSSAKSARKALAELK